MRLLRHWLHVFKRLLPAVVVVLLGVLTATWALHPAEPLAGCPRRGVGVAAVPAELAIGCTAVDYYAQDHSGASPLQHFWSLSVQGQVFILWPLIFAGVACCSRSWPSCFRTGRP